MRDMQCPICGKAFVSSRKSRKYCPSHTHKEKSAYCRRIIGHKAVMENAIPWVRHERQLAITVSDLQNATPEKFAKLVDQMELGIVVLGRL